MELWIRSQGKRKLVKIDNVLLKGIDTRLVIANYKGSNIADEGYFLLGEYKSTERALEVLDEIEEHIQKQGQSYILTDEKGLPAGLRNYGNIYEMPKE